MSSSSIYKRVAALPRAARWALGGGLLIALYFAAVEPMLDSMNKLIGTSVADERAVREYARSGGRLRSASETVSLGERRFGGVALPGDPQSRPSAFNQAVDAVLKRHDVREVTTTSRTAPMGANSPLAKYLGTGQRVERVMKELSFAATPEVVHAVLADLERAPEVATISRVQVRQGDDRQKPDRLLIVNVSLETWTVAKKERT